MYKGADRPASPYRRASPQHKTVRQTGFVPSTLQCTGIHGIVDQGRKAQSQAAREHRTSLLGIFTARPQLPMELDLKEEKYRGSLPDDIYSLFDPNDEFALRGYSS